VYDADVKDAVKEFKPIISVKLIVNELEPVGSVLIVYELD
jgi:hypothetical protein